MFAAWIRKLFAPKAIVEQPIYAHAGEWITCEEGHRICQFVKTVHRGDFSDAKSELGYWQQAEPVRGQFPLPVCAKCSSKFVRDGMVMHFEGGWRGRYQS